MVNKKIFNSIIMLLIVFMASFFVVIATDNDFSDINITLVNQDPSPVIAGSIVDVRVGVENVGYATANNVVVEAISEYPFTVVSNKVEEMGAVQSTNTDSTNIQIVKFKLKVADDISAGSYELKIKEYSKDNPNIYDEHSLFIDVKTRESLEIQSNDKSEILPGNISTITFKLKNVGSSILRDVIFSWENKDDVILPVGSDNSMYIKSINVGESINVSFDVLASSSAIANLYNLDLKVSYQDSIAGTDKDYMTKTGIYVGGDTNFDLVFDELSNGEYAFTIANIGANNAQSVTIKVPSQDSWKINSGNSEIIGNLNKGDYTTVSFGLVKLRGDSIDLIVDYTNTLGKRVSVFKKVKVFASEERLAMAGSSTGKKSGTGTGSGSGIRGMASGVNSVVSWTEYLGYGVLVLILMVIGMKFYKKRRK